MPRNRFLARVQAANDDWQPLPELPPDETLRHEVIVTAAYEEALTALRWHIPLDAWYAKTRGARASMVAVLREQRKVEYWTDQWRKKP